MTLDTPRADVLSPTEVRRIIFGIMVAMLLAALDQTIVVTALPTIGRDLGDTGKLPWIVTAYLLTSTAVTPLYGKVSDIVGRRLTLLVAISVFVAASVASALAPSMLVLILARAAQGLGGGGLISLAQTIIADIVSPRERPRYQGYIAAVFVTSSVAGPVLGGLFAERWHWSLIFWINLPLGALALVMTSGLLKRLPRHERPHKIDVAGAVLMVAATVSLMLALDWGGQSFGWLSPRTLALGGCSLALWVAFVWRLETAPEPLIPGDILKHPVVARATLSGLLALATLIALTAYMPMYFETVYGLSASHSGFALIPFMVGTVTGATISGRVMARVVNYKRLPLIGLAVAAITSACLALFAPHLPLLALEFTLPLVSLGLGANLPVTTVCVQNAVPPYQMGTATGTFNFFRSLGGALLTALFGAMLFTALPELAQLGSHGGGSASLAVEPQKVAAAFRPILAVAAVAFALSCASLWWMPQLPLRSRQPGANAAPAEEPSHA